MSEAIYNGQPSPDSKIEFSKEDGEPTPVDRHADDDTELPDADEKPTDRQVLRNIRHLLMSVVYAANKGIVPQAEVHGLLLTIVEAQIEALDGQLDQEAPDPDIVVGSAYELWRKVALI